MTVPVRCEHCGRAFTVAAALRGGYATCPACTRATPVEGLRDPWWRLLQVGAVLAMLAVVVLALERYGLAAGFIVAVAGAGLLWLGSRAL